MKLLVIGGTGIISTAVVEEAINQGIEVTMINRGNNKDMINPKAELIIGDTRNKPEEIVDVLKDRHFDTIIDFIVWNVDQLKLSLSLFSKKSDQYIFISSAQAYNTSIEGVKNEESEMCQPLWRYSVNKYKSELFLVKYCEENNVNYTIIRPGVNYGCTRIPYGLFPEIGKHWTFIDRILNDKYIPTWNKGMNSLNLTRVEDFATGTIGLVGNKKAYRESFNVVGDYTYTWLDVLNTLGRILNKDVKIIDIPVDFIASHLIGEDKEEILGGRACDLLCSNEKLRKVYPKFETRYDLEQGLKMTLDFYKSHNYYKGIDYYFEGRMDRIINDYITKSKCTTIPQQRFIEYHKTPQVTNSYEQYIMGYNESNRSLKIKRAIKDFVKLIIGQNTITSIKKLIKR